MAHDARTSQPASTRRPTNITLSEGLVAEARGLRLNVSQACEQGLAAAVKRERERVWLEENRAALDAWNDYVEKNGIPLSEYRQF